MITNTLGILLQVPFFVGLGLLFPWRPDRKRLTFERLLLTFFTGWGLAIGFLQLWHFFFKVDLLPLGLLVAGSLLGWALARAEVAAYFRSLPKKEAFWLAIVGLAPAVMIANHVMFSTPQADFGLYHLQAVTWINSYAIVPGLGNLHHRLAFNNSNFLLAAALNTGFLSGQAYYLSNTVLAYVIVLLGGAGVYNTICSKDGLLYHDWYYALMLPFALWQTGTAYVVGFSPDFPGFVLQFVLGGELLRLFELELEADALQRQSLYIVLLVAVGLTVKLSSAGFGFLILLAILGLWIVRYKFPLRQAGRYWLSWAGVLAAWVVPWLVRNLILSGYLLYPSTIISFPFPWTMPDYLAAPISAGISSWARTRSDTIPYTANWSWFLQWSHDFVYEVKQGFVLCLGLMAAGAGWFVLFRKTIVKNWKTATTGLAALAAISLASILYWFILAPDYRFSGAVFWTFLVSLILLGYDLVAAAGKVRLNSWGIVFLLLALTFWISPNHFSKDLSRQYILTPPSLAQVAAKARPADTLSSRTTDSGLVVYFPTVGPECWNFPLPCIPQNDYNPKLSLIVPGNLQAGFEMVK